MKEDRDLWKLYCKTIHSLRTSNSKAWIQTDLTMPQIKILFALAHKDELTVSSIAKILDVKVPNVTFILDHLVKKNLVSRKRDKEDRRLVIAALTNKGHKLVSKFIRAKFEGFQKALSNMDNRDKEALWQGLQALERACKSKLKGETGEQ